MTLGVLDLVGAEPQFDIVFLITKPKPDLVLVLDLN